MQPETIADRYRVVRAVGRGGMGTVWLCEDQVLSRQVAVKQIRPPEGESRADTARAMREARVAAALNHRNAVSIFDVVEQDDATWLVMEYVPSQTLAEIITAEGSLPPTRVAYIGAQVADALASAHALGIVHRDVKPGNVLVGENDLAKISDFGIARGHLDLSLTQTGMMTGTPAYFSPELARGEEPDSASDVWALGVTLYSATEGGPPYPTLGNPLAMLSAIVRDATPPPTQAGPLTDTLAAMLDRDPDARATMEQARGWLHQVAEQGSTSGESQTSQFPMAVVSPPEDTESDQSAPAAAAAATTAPYGGEDSPSAVSGWTHEETTYPPPDDDDRSSRGRWLAAAIALLVLLGAGWLLYTTIGGEGNQAGVNPVVAAGDTTTSQPTSPTSSSEQTKPPKKKPTKKSQSTEPETIAPTAQTTAPLTETTAPSTQTTTETTALPTQTTTETTAPSTQTTTETTALPTQTTTPTEETSPTETTTEETTSEPPPTPPAPSEEDFVSSYFAVAPADEDAGWAQLTSAFQQELGRGNYDGFWGPIDSVNVSGIDPAGGGYVNYTISYQYSSGETSAPERKQLQLVPAGDSYLINSDTTTG